MILILFKASVSSKDYVFYRDDFLLTASIYGSMYACVICLFRRITSETIGFFLSKS